MDDPILAAIAVALSTRAVEGMADAGKAAFASLVRLVRRKAADHSGLRTLIEAEPASLTSDDRDVALRRALVDAAAQDPLFDQELRRRWEIFQQATVRADTVTNTVSGRVAGPVVQARDIFGGVNLAPPPQQRHEP
ncbi:hypothetical protein MED01_002262 [Micromonospora sp. MED01]|uniref:hypothetical protein n=1 Tax=Micromonospora alfalfae TaxID=2911212 RepID=UPI001EE93A5F|nr:hypothetical protein [Micromonospora alfalfae]MCG5464099.1 hypothetical protein [Micromonospora alfalfae]